MAYTTIQAIRAYADIDSATDDEVIIPIIVAAQKAIDTYCGRTFEAAADSTRYFDTIRDTDGVKLFVDEDLAQITTVTNGDAVEVTSSEYTTLPRNRTPYYGIKILASSAKHWDVDSNDDPEGAISIAGRWAFSVTAPTDVQHACKELATFLYRRREMPTADVTAIEAGLVVRPFAIPPTVRALLDPIPAVNVTTFKAFIDNVNALTIEGVLRKYKYKPNSVSAADLPAQYVTLPGGGLNTATLSTCTTSGHARNCDLVILVESAGLGLTQDNQETVIDLLDEIEATLRTALDGATVMPTIEYSMVSDGNIVLGADVYWGIVVSISGEE